MKLSFKSDYAARAVLGLARSFSTGRAMPVEQLAAEQKVPPKYLVQILLELKARGIARSVRGKIGGYLLAKAPAQITLGDVIRATHGSVFESPAQEDSRCPPELRHAWNRLQSTLDRAADGINFQQLLDEGDTKDRMYYI